MNNSPNTNGKREEKIAELERNIEYENEQYRVALEYPTKNPQFYSALSKHGERIEAMIEELETLKKATPSPHNTQGVVTGGSGIDEPYFPAGCGWKTDVPKPDTSQEMERILDSVEKSLFDSADAMQNALGSTGDKVKEYLREWPPSWMTAETFTLDQVAEKSGTDKLRHHFHTLQSQLTTLQAQNAELREAISLCSGSCHSVLSSTPTL